MSTVPLSGRTKDLAALVGRYEDVILAAWLKGMAGATRRSDLMKDSDLQAQCSQFLRLLRGGLETGDLDFQSPGWSKTREMLGEVSRSRAVQGFTPIETASFVFSVKRPLLTQLQQE
jgi:rsbT co-antagonist protein RsbR